MNTLASGPNTASKLALGAALVCLMLITTYGQKPELVVQSGHSDTINSVAFSPNGEVLATGSTDKTIKLWDVATGLELRTLTGHADFVNSVAFSPDGKIVASGSRDKTVKLWNVSTGAELVTLKGHSDEVNTAVFSPDGKTVASAGGDKTIRVWDAPSGTLLRTLEGHKNMIHQVVFSPDGRLLASAGGFLLTDGNGHPRTDVSEDNTVRLWDIGTGAQLRVFNGHADQVWSVAFGPDGKTIASGSWDNVVKVWDVASGTVLQTLSGRSVRFSPDGKSLATGIAGGAIKLWNVGTGKESRTLIGHSDQISDLAFSPDGETLASGGNHTIILWHVSTGEQFHGISRQSAYLFSTAISPNGKTLASSRLDGSINVWDTSTGAGSRTLRGHSSAVLSIAFAPDGKILASASSGSIKLWDIGTGSELLTLKPRSEIVSVCFSPDGKILASGGWDKVVDLWDVRTGVLIKTLAGHTNAVNSIAFSPDGKMIASGSTDRTVKLWDIATGAEFGSLRESGYIVSVAFDPSGKILATGSYDKTVKLWDVASRAKLRTLAGHSDNITSVAFSHDGSLLASGSWDNTVKLWNASTGAELRTFRGHSGSVSSIALSPDNRFLVSVGFDASQKVWDVRSGKEVVAMFAFGDKDWIVVTPDGRFDGTPPAWDRVIWRFNNNTFDHAPVEAYFNEYYYPGLLKEIFDGSLPKASAEIGQKDRRQPKLVLRLAGSEPADANHPYAHALMRIVVSDAPAGAKDVRLFRNGFLIKAWQGDVMMGKDKVFLDASVPITAGSTEFTAYAFNKDDVKSRDAKMVLTDADLPVRKGVAYVLSIGVDRYANSGFDLKYAVADAQAFAGELKDQHAKIPNSDPSETTVLIDGNATKANILKAIADISAKILPEDSLTLYFAGHGTAQANRFYIIPHDLGFQGRRERLDGMGLKTILSHSISDEELRDVLEPIDARQIVLVIDACHSGQALEADEKRRGPMNSKGLAQLAYEKGMYILTAAQSYQAAKEATKLGHGFLTYALVEEGLKTDLADRDPKDGQVLLREWLDFATERVPQIQQVYDKARQLQQLDATRQADDNIQRPRVFYRREPDPHPMVVARIN